LSWTILQPASYMQNVLPKLPEILDRGIYSVPYPEDTRLGMVDLEDVAQVAVKMLTEGGHVAAIYELAGREVLSQREVAAILADQLGRPVSVGEEKYGFWGNPAILAHLLGREPTTFSEFVRRELASNRS
jgi:uncharacterized protein YbjT (DUF2867 family)